MCVLPGHPTLCRLHVQARVASYVWRSVLVVFVTVLKFPRSKGAFLNKFWQCQHCLQVAHSWLVELLMHGLFAHGLVASYGQAVQYLQTSAISTCRSLCWIDRQFIKAVHQENWAMRRLCQTCLTWRLLTQGPRRSRMRMQLRLAEPSCRTTFRSSDSRVGGLAWRWSSNVVTRLCSKDNESEMDNLDQIQRWATLHIYSVRQKSMFRFCLA